VTSAPLGLRSILDDEDITGALTGMIRDNWFDYTQTQVVGDALTLMANAGIAVAPTLLVEIPQEGSRSGAMAAVMPTPQLSPAAMSWLQRNRNNPRARRILDDIARGRMDPQAGFMIEQMMKQRPPPRPQ
jgi:DNA-binding transcriptional LysR family regulator